jgi:hypothetical protein
MDDTLNTWLIGGGLVLGLAFGAIVQRSRFCMMAAVSNLVLMRDLRQLHAYLAAIAVAILGTHLLEAGGWVEVAASAYRGARLDWVGAIGGGLMFGFDSTLAGGCAGRTLVNAVEGSAGGVLALLAFALTATVAQFGALEPLRAWLTEATALELSAGTASIAVLIGLPPVLLALAVSLVCVVIIALSGKAHPGLRVADAAVGGLVVAGWWVTGFVAQDDFEPVRPASLTFSGPLVRASLWLATGEYSGQGFDVALVAGVLAGAAMSALVGRSLRWVPPNPAQVGQCLAGGTLMGIGAILAGGCNIGQGLSGMSTLSLGSLLAVAAIFTGMRLGVGWLERSEQPSPWRGKVPGLSSG